MKHLLVIVSLVTLLGACAASRPATESIQQARVSIREAELAKAQELAAIELFAAHEKLQKAEDIVAKEPDQAWRYAEESKVDAQVAMNKAKEQSAENIYQSSKQGIEAVYGATKKSH